MGLGPNLNMYDLELERIANTIRESGYEFVCLQFPEGLMDRSAQVADEIRSRTGCRVAICSNPCYGACDIADEEAKKLGADALVHFGHTEILTRTATPVHYVEARMDADPIPLVKKNLDGIPKRVGLVTTVQHVHRLGEVKEFLAGEGYDARIGKAGGRTKYDGQVLGCSFASCKSVKDEVDSFLYIGSGGFHPLGVALSTGKKTLAFDILTNEVRDMEPLAKKTLKQRLSKAARAREAASFGVILCEKRGQHREKLALEIMDKLEAHGKKTYLLYVNEITPENLLPFRKLDALVNTACPRVAIEDAQRFKQPLLTPAELEMTLGERNWENYEMDEF